MRTASISALFVVLLVALVGCADRRRIAEVQAENQRTLQWAQSVKDSADRMERSVRSEHEAYREVLERIDRLTNEQQTQLAAWRQAPQRCRSPHLPAILLLDEERSRLVYGHWQLYRQRHQRYEGASIPARDNELAIALKKLAAGYNDVMTDMATAATRHRFTLANEIEASGCRSEAAGLYRSIAGLSDPEFASEARGASDALARTRR